MDGLDKYFVEAKAKGIPYEDAFSKYVTQFGGDPADSVKFMDIYDGKATSGGWGMGSLVGNSGSGVYSSLNPLLGGGSNPTAPTVPTAPVAPVVPTVDTTLPADFTFDTKPKTDAALTSTELFNKGGVNNLVGNNPYMSMAGAFGDKNTTGWAGTAMGLVSGISKGILGYKQFEETKKMNAEKLKLMKEANFMKKLKMKNQVNQANRYVALGMGNSNSQTATMRAVNSTPYTSMGL